MLRLQHHQCQADLLHTRAKKANLSEVWPQGFDEVEASAWEAEEKESTAKQAFDGLLEEMRRLRKRCRERVLNRNQLALPGQQMLDKFFTPAKKPKKDLVKKEESVNKESKMLRICWSALQFCW